MCKIMIAVGIKSTENAWKFAKEITPKLSFGNDDGLGYAAIDAKGKIFAERWLINKNAFLDYGLTEGDKKLLTTMGHDMFKEKTIDDYNMFGDKKPDQIVSLMLHARYATGTGPEKISIKNTHPFITKGTAIIHNGVIRNHEVLTKTMSTCDSETILHEYLGYNVAQEPEQIHGVVETIKGYYAVGVLTKDAAGKPIVDIFKSSTATLYTTFVDELGCIVFCTSKTDLNEVISKLGWKHNKVFEFGNDQYVRFNALTGERVSALKINPTEAYTAPTTYNTSHRDYDKDRTEFGDVVDKYQKEVDWVEMIEEEETKRLAARSVN